MTLQHHPSEVDRLKRELTDAQVQGNAAHSRMGGKTHYLLATGDKDFLSASTSARRWAPVGDDSARPLHIVGARLSFPDALPPRHFDCEKRCSKFSVTGTITATYQNRKLLDRMRQSMRRDRARYGWWNWHKNRGRMTLHPTPKDLRRVSWRRVL